VGHFRNTFTKAEPSARPPPTLDPSQTNPKEAFIRRLQKNFVKTQIEKNNTTINQEKTDSKAKPPSGLANASYQKHLSKLSQITNNNRSALLDQKRSSSSPFHNYLLKDLCSVVDNPKPPEKSISKDV